VAQRGAATQRALRRPPEAGVPAGTTTGRLVDIRWRPALLAKISNVGRTVDGYGPGQELNSTEQQHGHSDSWAFQLTVWVNMT
jgi:hypothetical protein